MTEYEAIVYDLDGTLVHLDVDWAVVRAACAGVFREEGVDPGGLDLWDMLDVSPAHGFHERIHETIATYEREGARDSRRLPLADDLPHAVPVGVCSLNAESACRRSLAAHDLDAHVDAIVGRDSLSHTKPHPEPLLRAVERIGADPDETLFVGDSESDAEAARRADVDFQFAAERIEGQRGRTP